MGLNPTILRQAQDFASFSALQITQSSLATLPRERFSCVPGMFSSLEVKVLYST
jgi:hypothetical protein